MDKHCPGPFKNLRKFSALSIQRSITLLNTGDLSSPFHQYIVGQQFFDYQSYSLDRNNQESKLLFHEVLVETGCHDVHVCMRVCKRKRFFLSLTCGNSSNPTECLVQVVSHCKLKSNNYLPKWHRDDLEFQWPSWEAFGILSTIHLTEALGKKVGKVSNHNKWPFLLLC